MGSHSVTCHPAEVTFQPLPQPKLVLDLATPEGCKAELACDTETRQKMAILGQNHSHKEKFSELFYQGSIEDTDWHFFAQISCRSVPLQRKTNSLPVTKHALFSPPFCAPLVLTREIWVQPTHAVKFYRDRLRFAGVIREKPILSKYILRCHAYAWERTISDGSEAGEQLPMLVIVMTE